MLTIISPAIITTALLLCAIGCDNKDYSNASPFDNVVYLDAAKLKDVSNFTFNRTIETGQKEISALLARPAGEDINVGIKVDASLVNTYNARLGANYTMLDAKHYKLSAGQTVIPQGEVSSNLSLSTSPVLLTLKLMQAICSPSLSTRCRVVWVH